MLCSVKNRNTKKTEEWNWFKTWSQVINIIKSKAWSHAYLFTNKIIYQKAQNTFVEKLINTSPHIVQNYKQYWHSDFEWWRQEPVSWLAETWMKQITKLSEDNNGEEMKIDDEWGRWKRKCERNKEKGIFVQLYTRKFSFFLSRLLKEINALPLWDFNLMSLHIFLNQTQDFIRLISISQKTTPTKQPLH